MSDNWFDDLDDGLTSPTSGKAPATPEDMRRAAHMAVGGDSLNATCPACRGTGTFRSWSGRAVGACFKCKGGGKVSARVAGAAKAKATRERNEAERRADFADAHEAEIAFLRDNAEWSDFYRSLYDKLCEYGTLTERQIEAVRNGMAKQAAKREERKAARMAAAPTIDMAAIEALFATARANGLRKMAFRTDRLNVSPAPDHGRNAGSLYVKDRGEYAGKITAGKFLAVREAAADVADKLTELAADPAGVARFYGRETGVCCCCGRELTDPVSVANGIGPICAESWGL